MKNEIRKERNKLLKNSKRLRTLSKCVDNYSKSKQIEKEQEETYKKWLFYDEFIKANDKIKNNLGGEE